MVRAADSASLTTEFRSRLLAFVRRRGLGDEAEDVVQEILLRAHQGSAELDPRRSVESWLFAIARNAVVDWYRRRAARARLRDSAAVELSALDAPTDEQAGELERELSRCLEPLIEALDPKYAQALQRCDLQGEPQAQLAQELGLSLSAVKSRVSRGRRLLLAELLSCCQVTRGADGAPVEVQPREAEQGSCTRCGFEG